MLGIEGAKLELIIPDKVTAETGIITGIIKLTSLSDNNIVESIHLQMIEKYSRGRGKVSWSMNILWANLWKENLNFSKNDIVEIPFEMEFVYIKSEMDKMGESNFSEGLW